MNPPFTYIEAKLELVEITISITFCLVRKASAYNGKGSNCDGYSYFFKGIFNDRVRIIRIKGIILFRKSKECLGRRSLDMGYI